MTNYQTGDYVKRGGNIYRVEAAYDGPAGQVIFIAGPWNIARFQKGELVTVSELIQPATEADYLANIEQLQILLNQRLENLKRDLGA